MRYGFVLTVTIVVAVLGGASQGTAECLRFSSAQVGLSEIAATDAARARLAEVAAESFKARGWAGKDKLRTRGEKVSCAPYSILGGLNIGDRCVVASTFCVRLPKASSEAVRQRKAQADGNEDVVKPNASVSAGQQATKPKIKTGSIRRPARRKKRVGAVGKVITLRLRGSQFEISGILKRFDKQHYVLAPKDSDDVTVPVEGVDCISAVCPRIKK